MNIGSTQEMTFTSTLNELTQDVTIAFFDKNTLAPLGELVINEFMGRSFILALQDIFREARGRFSEFEENLEASTQIFDGENGEMTYT